MQDNLGIHVITPQLLLITYLDRQPDRSTAWRGVVACVLAPHPYGGFSVLAKTVFLILPCVCGG